jgi:hypothetical protein
MSSGHKEKAMIAELITALNKFTAQDDADIDDSFAAQIGVIPAGYTASEWAAEKVLTYIKLNAAIPLLKTVDASKAQVYADMDTKYGKIK